MNGLFFWILLMVAFYVVYRMGVRNAGARARAIPPVIEVPRDRIAELEAKLSPMLAISGHKTVGPTVFFDGQLRGDPHAAFEQIRQAFLGEDVTPMLLEGEGHDVRIALMPAKETAGAAAARPRYWLHWLLFAATLATTTWAGALHSGVNLLDAPERFAVGLPYSLGLLLILGAHELGHYFTAKHHGIEVTPPYFIPVPFALGTFGAFIRIKSLTRDRNALFDVAVAGPLAGLVFAIPALYFGLKMSVVLPYGDIGGTARAGVDVGSSALLSCLAKLALGSSAVDGRQLLLHPLAFAGWLGLIVTALNLLPIGQLDGGHISHALFGSRRARFISTAGLVCLFLLALFVWPGLMLWAFIVYFIAGTRDMPAADDVTPVDFGRKLLGCVSFLILLFIIVPVPHAYHEAVGLHGPYL